METSTYTYRIDGSDRITYVSPHFSSFAKDNDAPELDGAQIVGRDIWEFIVGDEVRNLYREVFRSLRLGHHEMMLPFRCDSPDKVRHMELVMRSTPGHGIEFEGKLNLTLERDPVSLFDTRAKRSDTSVRICSFCRRLDIEGDWLAAGDAITRQRWFGQRSVPRLREALCRDCLGGLQKDLGVV